VTVESSSPAAPAEISRLLLVRLREIGDVVFTTPAVRAIRQRFPDARISYLVEPAAAPVVAHNPHIDEVIVVTRTGGLRGLGAEASLVRRLRASSYDVAIDFHGGPRASLLTWLSGARVRIGYDVVGRGWMYTRRVGRPRELRARHSVENQWDLLTPFGIAPPDPAVFPVEMPVAPSDATAVDERLARAGVPRFGRVIVMHVSAGNPFRRWPIASFAAVAAELAASDWRHRVVITSGPSDRDAAARVITEARARLGVDHRGRVLACGDFSLVELRALVDRAALFVGGDSGPLHVAATSQVPIVGLYGPTLPARSAPWRAAVWPAESLEIHGLPCRPCDQRSCQPGDFRCLAWIQPQHVIDGARRALARASG
jgi:predicted lipopolysaccharide heptosyltransferase III